MAYLDLLALWLGHHIPEEELLGICMCDYYIAV